MITIERYRADMREDWNGFVRQARNATFLFDRGFMDYHSDRFDDYSLIFRKNGRIIALLPADITEDTEGWILHSHRGLTYGGLILPTRHCGAEEVMEILDVLLAYCRDNQIYSIDYKALPYIYATVPAQEDIYALWRHGAVMTECNLAVTIDLLHNPGFDSRQKRNCKRAQHSNGQVIKVGADDEIEAFHRMLTLCLAERHETRPVHTADELKLLHSRFPSEIEFYVMMEDGEMQAGVCLFNCGMTVHAQYICTTERGRQQGMMAMLMDSVIRSATARGARYFDFGTCNEDGGRYLNLGLTTQKYGLGGTGVAYPRFRLMVE